MPVSSLQTMGAGCQFVCTTLGKPSSPTVPYSLSGFLVTTVPTASGDAGDASYRAGTVLVIVLLLLALLIHCCGIEPIFLCRPALPHILYIYPTSPRSCTTLCPEFYLCRYVPLLLESAPRGGIGRATYPLMHFLPVLCCCTIHYPVHCLYAALYTILCCRVRHGGMTTDAGKLCASHRKLLFATL
jgi:hypothetical protein